MPARFRHSGHPGAGASFALRAGGLQGDAADVLTTMAPQAQVFGLAGDDPFRGPRDLANAANQSHRRLAE